MRAFYLGLAALALEILLVGAAGWAKVSVIENDVTWIKQWISEQDRE